MVEAAAVGAVTPSPELIDLAARPGAEPKILLREAPFLSIMTNVRERPR